MKPEDRQRRVLALYRKAAGTDSLAERDAFLAKARELDVETVDPDPSWRQAAADIDRFFGGKRQAAPETDDPRDARRASWRRYAAKVATTPEFKARRAAYMAEYRRRKAAVTAGERQVRDAPDAHTRRTSSHADPDPFGG